MHLFLLVLMLGVSSAELRRQGREDMEACPDQACRNAVLQQLVIKLQEAAADEKSKEKAAADEEIKARRAERVRHGGPSGNEGQYWEFEGKDLRKIDRSLWSGDCLAMVNRPLLSPPSERYTVQDYERVTRPSAPICVNIQWDEPTLRYCQLNWNGYAWHVIRKFADHYWPAKEREEYMQMALDGCFNRVRAAFNNSTDRGFRLSLLDFVEETVRAGFDFAPQFLKEAVEAEKDPQVKERLKWLANSASGSGGGPVQSAHR